VCTCIIGDGGRKVGGRMQGFASVDGLKKKRHWGARKVGLKGDKRVVAWRVGD